MIYNIVEQIFRLSVVWLECKKNCHRLYSGYSNQTDKKVLISTWQSLYKLLKKYLNSLALYLVMKHIYLNLNHLQKL